MDLQYNLKLKEQIFSVSPEASLLFPGTASDRPPMHASATAGMQEHRRSLSNLLRHVIDFSVGSLWIVGLAMTSLLVRLDLSELVMVTQVS